jgi:hypothetical protein
MARFEDEDLTGAEFREVVLDRARLIGVVMQDAVIDGLVTNLVVNGVEVTEYVEAELDRRHPVRPLLRSADPDDLRRGWAAIQADWDATIARLEAGPPGREHASVGGEWSAVQTLRHLVFVTDSWFRRAVLGEPRPFHPWGLAPAFIHEPEAIGLDPSADPTLAEVLAVRTERVAEVTAYLDGATANDLHAGAPPTGGPGWPPGQARTVLDCLHVLLDEEWAHHQFCVRDLDALDAEVTAAGRSDLRSPGATASRGPSRSRR